MAAVFRLGGVQVFNRRASQASSSLINAVSLLVAFKPPQRCHRADVLVYQLKSQTTRSAWPWGPSCGPLPTHPNKSKHLLGPRKPENLQHEGLWNGRRDPALDAHSGKRGPELKTWECS